MKPDVHYKTFCNTFFLTCLKYFTIKFKTPTITETTKNSKSLKGRHGVREVKKFLLHQSPVYKYTYSELDGVTGNQRFSILSLSA